MWAGDLEVTAGTEPYVNREGCTRSARLTAVRVFQVRDEEGLSQGAVRGGRRDGSSGDQEAVAVGTGELGEEPEAPPGEGRAEKLYFLLHGLIFVLPRARDTVQTGPYLIESDVVRVEGDLLGLGHPGWWPLVHVTLILLGTREA